MLRQTRRIALVLTIASRSSSSIKKINTCEENDRDRSLQLASNIRRCQDEEIDPAILLGRTVVVFFFKEGPYVGTVTSFRGPDEDVSLDIAKSGTWFTVTFEDKDSEEYTYEL